MIAEIISLPRYESQVVAVLNEEERMAMEFYIACAPEDHPVISGAGGFRKARWAVQGKGKSGGLRVIYFFLAKTRAGLYGRDLRQIAKGDPFGGGSERARKTCSTDQESSKGRAMIIWVCGI